MLKELVIVGALVAAVLAREPFTVQFQWNYIDFTWPSQEVRDKAIRDREYILENNPITGIKLWKNEIYLAIARWKDGVPVTLASTSAAPIQGNTNPPLKPYPNWDMQKMGDCSAFQFVQSMEIDPLGRMWVLDTGRTATWKLETKARCPPRLVILDLEDEGKVLRSYPFPDEVARHESAFLSDIVLDHEDGGVAYITDSDDQDPGIIVFSLKNRNSWKIRHDSMKAKSEAIGFTVDHTRIHKAINLEGIALSAASQEGGRVVYYSPLSSYQLFSLPTSVLKNDTERNVEGSVRVMGRKPSQTDAMVMSTTGVLYFGLLGDDAVAMWDTKTNPSFQTGQRIISRDHNLMQWPGSFGFNEKGQLWCITTRLQNFINNAVDISVPNYRVIMSNTYSMNYQYFENGTSPEMPKITAGASSMSRETFIFASLLALLQVVLMK